MKKPQNVPELIECVVIAKAVARQLGVDVYVQYFSSGGKYYNIRLTDKTPENRQRRNCYRVGPSGVIWAFPGNLEWEEVEKP